MGIIYVYGFTGGLAGSKPKPTAIFHVIDCVTVSIDSDGNTVYRMVGRAIQGTFIPNCITQKINDSIVADGAADITSGCDIYRTEFNRIPKLADARAGGGDEGGDADRVFFTRQADLGRRC